MRFPLIVAAAVLAPCTAAAQTQNIEVLSPAQQIALAVLPAPAGLREASTVLGYRPDGRLVRLRTGDNGIICLADDPREPNFHAACYYSGLEPFMASGRAIRARHGADKQALSDSIRLAEIRRGKYKIPANAVLYQIFAAGDSVDVATAKVKSPSYLHVVYTPYATAKTTGISTDAMRGTPWLMYPGKPWAHIMIVP